MGTLYHPVMDDPQKVWKAQLAMIEKRGGNLCAPVPKPLGKCGYINQDVQVESKEQLALRLAEYKEICAKYPRGGMGIDAHCTDVGLEDPQSKKENPMKVEENRFVVTPIDRAVVSLGKACACCRNDKKARTNIMDAQRILDGTDSMAAKYSTQPSAELLHISRETSKTNPMWKTLEQQGKTTRLMEAEMISGQVEGQLLQMLVRFGGVKKALDIGTFTGYSALSLAEALPNGGSLVTLEREAGAAQIAASNWASSPHAEKIKSLVGEAPSLLDKLGYLPIYKQLMDSNLLRVGGLLVVDNTMYKGEALSGEPLSKNGQGAYDLNQFLLADDRVTQVMLPLRDGVTLIHRIKEKKTIKLPGDVEEAGNVGGGYPTK